MCRSGFSADAERKSGMQFPAGGGTESESREQTKASGFHTVCMLESVGGVCKPILSERQHGNCGRQAAKCGLHG